MKNTPHSPASPTRSADTLPAGPCSLRSGCCLIRRSLLLLLALAAATGAQAFSPTVFKIHGRSANSPANNHFGGAISICEGFVAVGQPEDDDVAADAGAVHLFSGKGKSYMRKFKAADGAAGDQFGFSVAVLGNLLVIGAPGDDDAGIDAGAIYAFENNTARLLGKITASDAAPGDRFGSSLAISHDRLAVGAPKGEGLNPDAGAVYLFQVLVFGGRPAMGTELLKITAPDGETDEDFGTCVSLCGPFVGVGAPMDDENGAGSGSAYVFDAATGGQLRKLIPADGAAGNLFGSSLSIDSRRVLVGAPFAFDGVSSFPGVAYLFEMGVGALVTKLIPTAGANDDRFGLSVALLGHLALVGAPHYDDKGRIDTGGAFLYEIPSGSFVGLLTAPELAAGDHLGKSVGLLDNFAIAGAESDDDLGADSGSAYTFEPVNGKLPLRLVAKRGDYAPDTVTGVLTKFGDSFINQDSETLLQSSMASLQKGLESAIKTGVPAPPAIERNATGLFGDIGGLLGGFAQTSDLLLGGEKIKSLSAPLFNNPAIGVTQALLAPSTLTGVTSANSKVVLGLNGGAIGTVVRTGTPIAAFDAATATAFPQVVQGRSAADEVGVAYSLRVGSGTPAVTRASDSGTLMASSAGALLDTVAREGKPVPNSLGVFFGQSFGRVAVPPTGGITAASYLIGIGGLGTAPTEALMMKPAAGDWMTAFFRDHPMFGGPFGTFFGSMLGETMGPAGELIYRTTITGTGVTSKNNEAVSQQTAGIIAREGSAPDPAVPGVVFRRLLKFWPGPGGQVFVLVTLGGTGVNSRNDTALYLYQENGQLLRLLREGEQLCAPESFQIGVISRVDVDAASGHYAILASLSAAPAKNLAILTGHSQAGNATDLKSLRLPTIRLRKGLYYQARPGDAARILTLSLPATTTDRTGAGSKGFGQIINGAGELVVTVTFDNKSMEVMSGTP